MAAGNFSNIDIVINIIVQAFNIFVFLFVFKYFLADKIVESVENRKRLLEKIKKAEEEYERLISEANKEKEKIIKDALQHKDKVIEEAKAVAYQEKEKILSEAKKQAEEIIENAKSYGEKLKRQLENEWERALKYTAKLVVMKLFENNIELQDKYLEEVVKQFSK